MHAYIINNAAILRLHFNQMVNNAMYKLNQKIKLTKCNPFGLSSYCLFSLLRYVSFSCLFSVCMSIVVIFCYGLLVSGFLKLNQLLVYCACILVLGPYVYVSNLVCSCHFAFSFVQII